MIRSQQKIVNVLVAAAFLAPCGLKGDTVLSIGSAPAYPGATLTLPVSLIRATNIVAAQFDVTFDPARVASGPALPEAAGRQTVMSREIAPGVRRVLVFSRQSSVITNRNPAQLPFTISPTEYASSGPLRPTNPILAKNNGTAATPPPTLISGTIFVRPVNLLPDGRVQFFLPSTPDQRYYIQASTDLSHWTNISTNVATGTFLDLIDLDAAAYPYRFYRWQSAD